MNDHQLTMAPYSIEQTAPDGFQSSWAWLHPAPAERKPRHRADTPAK